SLEAGKEADFIALDPSLTVPLPGVVAPADDPASSDAEALISRLIFRAHPAMVRGAWVRGRRLAGPVGCGPCYSTTMPLARGCWPAASDARISPVSRGK